MLYDISGRNACLETCSGELTIFLALRSLTGASKCRYPLLRNHRSFELNIRVTLKCKTRKGKGLWPSSILSGLRERTRYAFTTSKMPATNVRYDICYHHRRSVRYESTSHLRLCKSSARQYSGSYST